MDKHILFVKSDIVSTRALENRNLVSFHKRFECCFNATVFEAIGVRPGMYAKFANVNLDDRLIKLVIADERPSEEKSKWYKIRNPQVSTHNKYCYIRTTNLVYDFDLLPLGAFEYHYFEKDETDINGMKVVYIMF